MQAVRSRHCQEKWMLLYIERWYYPDCTFERYADNAIIHCVSEQRAREIKEKLSARMEACGLELHPEKTKIVYCKDSNRRGSHDQVTFEFLGYRFMPRLAQNSIRKVWFTNCLPAVSKKAMKRMNERMRGLGIFRAIDITLTALAGKINPLLRGWISYYGKFYTSKLRNFMHNLNAKNCQLGKTEVQEPPVK